MGQMQLRTTELLLEQWALWCSFDKILNLTFPHKSAFVHIKQRHKKSLLTISEDEAMKIDSILAKLINRSPETGEAVVLYFFCKCNISSVARALEIDQRRANVLVQSGVAWIDAVLFSEYPS